MIGRPLVKSFRFLNQKLITPARHYFFPKQFTFITLTPQQNLEFKSFPHQEWPSRKSEQSQLNKSNLFCLFLICFFIGDWIYTAKNNQNVMYFYYINYPMAMKLLETMIYKTEKSFSPFVDIIPKQKYQVPLIWSKLKNVIFNTQDKQKVKNENVQQLKIEIAEMDKKFN